MEIKKEVRDKIASYVVKRHILDNSNDIKKSGWNNLEINYRLSINNKCKGYIFVVYQKLEYYGGSLKDMNTKVLAFDEKTGDLVPDFEEKGGCYPTFYRDIKVIDTI